MNSEQAQELIAAIRYLRNTGAWPFGEVPPPVVEVAQEMLSTPNNQAVIYEALWQATIALQNELSILHQDREGEPELLALADVCEDVAMGRIAVLGNGVLREILPGDSTLSPPIRAEQICLAAASMIRQLLLEKKLLQATVEIQEAYSERKNHGPIR